MHIHLIRGKAEMPHREFEPRAQAVTAGRGSKGELVKAFVRSNLADTFTFADVKRAAPGVSDEYIRQVLRALRDEGLVEVVGAGRGAVWRRVAASGGETTA